MSSEEEDQEILNILAENGIKVTNPKKKHQNRIQILENILIYKPDNDLLHAINIAAESDLATESRQRETPSEVDKQELSLASILNVATENGTEMEFEDTVFVTGIDEGTPESNAIIEILCEATEGVSDSAITHFATNDSPTIGVVELDATTTETITDTETLVVESGLETIDTEGPKNKPIRSKHADCKEWKKNITKEKRMRGECYLGYSRKEKIVTTGIQRSGRQMGPTCDSKFCKKSAKRFCSDFGEHDRQLIFDNFWKELDWSGKKSFVTSMIDKVPIKQKTVDSNKKQQSYVYYLKLNEETNQVCKKMFLNTLGIKERMVLTWISEAKSGISLAETTKLKSKRGKTKSTETPTSRGISQAEHLQKFFEGIPKLPSHYCRSTSTKLYLEPVFESKSHVYEIYKEKCACDKVKPISACFFFNKFDNLNLSITKPKKDRCDICCGYETKNVTEEVYKKHIEKKNAARLEKESDKLLAIDGKITVLTIDLQSVKVCPKVQASAVYYKTKLCCHNFTVYNLATHEVTCYWWHECEGELQASNFASCLVDYIQENVSKTLPLVIFSDGCTAQNRNSIMANALLDLAMKDNMVITQKYLEKGHTQMECDSVHSVIEIKLKKNDINLPHEYVKLTKDAKKKTPKYDAKYLSHEFFKDFSGLQRYTSIRPGRKAGDPTVTDIRQLQYDPDGKIKFKLNFTDELQELPIRSKLGTYTINPMYTRRIPLKPRKWKDLQDLKHILPTDCHSFYDNLPKTTTD